MEIRFLPIHTCHAYTNSTLCSPTKKPTEMSDVKQEQKSAWNIDEKGQFACCC